MLIALTGTPGTGKSSVAVLLQKTGYTVVDVNRLAVEKGFILGKDRTRNSKILDLDRLNTYVHTTFTNDEKLVFLEGHVTHLLEAVDKVIILRCHPTTLQKRLEKKGWKQDKIRENVEAETLDVILCETMDFHSENNVFEINTTNHSIEAVASSIKEIIDHQFTPMKKYNIGNIDWSEEILNTF